MYTEPNMGLVIWNLLTDLFDHNALGNNLVAIGAHDHSSNKGVQISTAGIANGAITAAKIANNTITNSQIGANTIGLGQLVAGVGRFQMVASNIATVNAVDGQAIFAYNGTGQTVTLPSSPTAGNQVAVFSANSSGTNPVTVSAGSNNIVGVGLNATSFLLGTPSSCALLVWDGARWEIIAGQQDTGWVALSLATNVGAAGGYYAPTSRLVGDRVTLRGAIQNNTGNPVTTGTTVATIAAGSRPASTILGPVVFRSGSNDPATVTINSSGQIAPFGSSWGSTLLGGLDGVSYSLS